MMLQEAKINYLTLAKKRLEWGTLRLLVPSSFGPLTFLAPHVCGFVWRAYFARRLYFFRTSRSFS